jgi:hypothetical protein
MAKPNPKKKVRTLDDFAAAIHGDYLAIREEMAIGFQAVGAEMGSIRDTMATKAELREVRDDVKRITDAMVSKADLEAPPRRATPRD